jgi:hypothetical protein
MQEDASEEVVEEEKLPDTSDENEPKVIMPN